MARCLTRFILRFALRMLVMVVAAPLYLCQCCRGSLLTYALYAGNLTQRCRRSSPQRFAAQRIFYVSMVRRSRPATTLMHQLVYVFVLFGSVASALQSPLPPLAQLPPPPPLSPGWFLVSSARALKDSVGGQRLPAVFLLSAEQRFLLGDLMPQDGSGFLKLNSGS